MVALRKESVDRNHTNVLPSVEVKPSLSARRAWIEIWDAQGRTLPAGVSLSARRAWIEIQCCNSHSKRQQVALRKESVDRNRWGDYSTGAATVALRKESVDRNVGA